MRATVKVLGGLKVTVEFVPYAADHSVGLEEGVEYWGIVEINDRICKKPPNWLYDRINATKGEEERILQACYAVMDDLCHEDFDDGNDTTYY
jgi:hypothetical protein